MGRTYSIPSEKLVPMLEAWVVEQIDHCKTEMQAADTQDDFRYWRGQCNAFVLMLDKLKEAM